MAFARTWWFYAALWLLMMALRQDLWLWTDRRLVFGFLPVGLASQAVYSLIASAVMFMLVRLAWPKELEHLEGDASTRP